MLQTNLHYPALIFIRKNFQRCPKFSVVKLIIFYRSFQSTSHNSHKTAAAFANSSNTIDKFVRHIGKL